MWWNIIFAIASYAIQLVLTPKPPNAKPKSLEDFQAPTATEGRELGVVFGTVDIPDPNVTWYGDLGKRAITGARRYGLFGPRQVLGYKYFLGMQMGLCHGPADALLRITVGDKIAWRGVSAGGRINIKKDNLFGGNQSEGGVSGAVDIEMGAPDQGQNDYLLAKLGDKVSAYRGLVTLVLRKFYVGTSNYIKPWEVRLQRIHLRSDGSPQWYDAKAAIPAQEVLASDKNNVGRAVLTDFLFDQIDTNGDYAARGASDGLVQTWLMPDGDVQSATLPGEVLRTDIHVTNSDELVVRTGGDLSGHPSTALEFRDIANPASVNQSINLDDAIDAAGASHLNFGFQMADISVGGSNVALVGIRDNAESKIKVWLLLNRSGDTWAVSGLPHPRVNDVAIGALSLSMGPTYAYASINGTTDILRLTWNGSWAEAVISPPGITGSSINTVSASPAGQVVVISDAGDMFVYNEDLSTLLRSSIGNSVHLGAIAVAKRMWVSSTTFVVTDQTGGGTITRAYFVPTGDLSLIDYFDVANSSLTHHGSGNMLSFSYNQNNGYAAVEGSAGLFFWQIEATVFDMNAAHIIRECITDAIWGMGYTDDDIDDTSFIYSADTFFSELFGLSLRWVQEDEIEKFVSTILSHVDAYLYGSRSTGKFVLKPIRDDYDIDLIPLLTEDDILEFTEIKRRQKSEATSSVLLKYYNRAKRKVGAHRVTNIAQAMQATGNVPPVTREYSGINRADLAIRVAERDVVALGSGLISGRIIVKPRNLNPGDPFRVVSPRHGLSGEVLRVAGLRFGDGRDNKMGVTLFQDVFRLGRSVIIDDGNSGGGWVPPSNDPRAVSPRLAWEMPYREMRQMVGDADLASLLSGNAGAGLLQVAGVQPSGDATNADIKVDAGAGYDGSEQMDFAPGGFISGDLAIDATAVTISADSGVDATAIGQLATIGNGSRYGTEVVRVDGVAGNVLTIARGCLDTVPMAHATGAAFVLFDNLSTSDFETYGDGQTINVKMLTNTGSGQLSQGAAPTDAVAFASRAIRPLRPANVTVAGIDYGIVIGGVADLATSWVKRNRTTEMTPLDWTEASVDPEAGQTTIIEALDAAKAVLTTHSGLSGTGFPVPVSSFAGQSSGWLRFGSERDGYREWQAYEIRVLFSRLDTGVFVLTGNAAGLVYSIVMPAATGAYTLTGYPAGLGLASPVATGVYTLTGNPAGLQFSAGIVASTGVYTLTGNAVGLIYDQGERDAPLPGLFVNAIGSRQSPLPGLFLNT